VAPGAVAAMVAHLERDPAIGVVGPLTNAIGNEARVAVAYADMAAMAAEMRRVTTGHRGQASDIRVAAYFCAMLRRRDFERFGPLAEVFGQGMFEDDDHCAEIRAQGYRCVLAEDAFVHHHLSASFDALGADRKRDLFERNRAVFEARRGPWVPHAYRISRPAPTLEPRR
jgi:O-antigen biosynthesis protein